MITNVNTGVCQWRATNNKPCFFVNWQENGKQNYKYFSIVYPMNKLYEKLKNKLIMNDMLKVIAFVKVYGLNLYGVLHFNLDHGKDNLESYFIDKLGWSKNRLYKVIKLLRDKDIIRKEKADVPNLYSLSITHKWEIVNN